MKTKDKKGDCKERVTARNEKSNSNIIKITLYCHALWLQNAMVLLKNKEKEML